VQIESSKQGRRRRPRRRYEPGRRAAAVLATTDGRAAVLFNWLSRDASNGRLSFSPRRVQDWLALGARELRQLEDRLARAGLIVVEWRSRLEHRVFVPLSPRGRRWVS